jgi:hypothetical protein
VNDQNAALEIEDLEPREHLEVFASWVKVIFDMHAFVFLRNGWRW